MITSNKFNAKFWTFPGGERGVKIVNPYWFQYDKTPVLIKCDFRSSDDIIDLLLLKDAIDEVNETGAKVILNIPYFPYARQDRRCAHGESHSLKVISRLINSCKFDQVCVVDPHSDVVEALIDNIFIIKQEINAESVLRKYDLEQIVLVAPDAGAAKKIYKLASIIKRPVIVAQKERDMDTGNIIRSYISETDAKLIENKDVWIIDDICDGGKTFIELSKALNGAKSLNLYTTHGIYSKGKKVLTDIFDEVLCYNDMSVNNQG